MTAPPEPSPKPEPPQGKSQLRRVYAIFIATWTFFGFFCSSIVDEVNAEAEKEKRQIAYVKTYVSPWERAMKDDEELKETMKLKMPGPQVHKELPKYKSFNRY